VLFRSSAFNGSGSGSALVTWHEGVASEPVSYNFPITGGGNEESTSGCVEITGADNTTPLGTVGAKNEGTSTTATALAFNASSSDSIIISVYFCDSANFTSVNDGTEILRHTSANAGNVQLAMSWAASPGAGNTTGNSTATLGSDDWVAWKFEVKSASVGGGGGDLLSMMNYYK